MALSDECLGELASLSGVALAHEDLASALEEICRISVRALPPAEGASMTAFSERGPRAVAASDDWAKGLDEVQHAESEGPCLDAARTGLVFRVRNMADEPRWPSYAPLAAEAEVRSMVSLPLAAENKLLGALNVYSRTPDAFGPEEVSAAEIIAGHASLASQVAATLFGHKELAEGLQAAMASRATIEQAKGIIMATTRCDPDAAFAVLVQQSQHENRKLRDVAQQIVARYSAADAGA